VALVSIAASGLLAAGKLAVGLATGSLGIVSEAIHSGIDCGATIITYLAVRAGDRPADATHPYGHGKIESVAALGETALLFLAGAWIGLEAVERLLAGGVPVEATPAAVAILVVSIVVDFWRARALSRVAAETRSPALEADALHFSSDMLSSMVVLAGLGLVSLGYPAADALAALAVAGFILLAAVRLARRTVDVLIDTAPPGAVREITELLAAMPGVISVERVRLRPLGGSLFVEIVVGVSRALPLDRAAALKERIAAAVCRVRPGAEVVVTTVPRALDDETARDRVAVIAANQSLAIHHVTVQHLGEHLSISLDLELDGRLDLEAAHAVASDLEARIRDELGRDVEVETHIEPLALDGVSGREIGGGEREAIAAALAAHAEAGGLVRDVHDLRVRQTAEGLVVNFHARAPASATVRDVHEAVDRIERRVRRDFPTIRRVVGHAEPASPGPGAAPPGPHVARRESKA